jgi:hypothetical protein
MRNHGATLTFGKEGELAITGISADNVEKIVKTKLGGASATT